MSLLRDILAGAARRQVTLENPGEMSSTFVGTPSYSGRTVSVQGSLSLIPVLSCVTIVAGSIGSLPLIVYRRLDGDSRERAQNHRAWRLLHDVPNPEMAADEVWELVAEHLNLWGNAYIWKARDNLGIVRELWPLSPKRFSVGRDNQMRRYFRVDGQGPFFEEDILHIRGLSSDGLVGYSPIQLARQALGNAAAQEEFQGRFLGGGGKPAVLLRHPNRLSAEAEERLKQGWNRVERGGTAVLEEAIEVEKMTMPLEDAQFIEQMQFSDLRIAQLFQVPPSMIGAKTGDSLTYTTTEQQGISFVTYTLRRWLQRIQGALGRDPSIFTQGDRFYAEFLTSALQSADLKTRYGAYQTAIKAGFLTVDEVRAMENRPALGSQGDPNA